MGWSCIAKKVLDNSDLLFGYLIFCQVYCTAVESYIIPSYISFWLLYKRSIAQYTVFKYTRVK